MESITKCVKLNRVVTSTFWSSFCWAKPGCRGAASRQNETTKMLHQRETNELFCTAKPKSFARNSLYDSLLISDLGEFVECKKKEEKQKELSTAMKSSSSNKATTRKNSFVFIVFGGVFSGSVIKLREQQNVTKKCVVAFNWANHMRVSCDGKMCCIQGLAMSMPAILSLSLLFSFFLTFLSHRCAQIGQPNA